VSETLEAKVHALKAHKSQVGDGEHLMERMSERARELGKDRGIEMAEAFKVVKMRR
jgi:LmbE family N-acetylglucosaminyl deacetylase